MSRIIRAWRFSMGMDTYEITVWTDKNGKVHTAPSRIQAGSASEAKAKFKATHNDCKSVQGVHKK